MSAATSAAYEVEAYNTAKESENKIHDDSVARKFGFTGGLVPGVDVYAYMTHLPVQRWGHAWLERGVATCRLDKPVYDGNIARVTAAETAEGLAIEVRSEGQLCATGTASLPQAAEVAPDAAAYRRATPPDEGNRPPASATSLAEGTWLNSRPIPLTPELATQYLKDLRETDTLYEREGLAHPGFVLRMCNRVLSHNVVLGPWIHVGSVVRHCGVGHVGEAITCRARVSANYERKGHRFVELDALVLAGERPVAHVTHTAIWLPRQLAAA